MSAVLPDPYAMESEQGIIGSILSQPETLADVRGIVSHADFWEPRHARLYAHACAVADKGRQLNLETFADGISPRTPPTPSSATPP
jgi:replicative DNA helicase